MQYNFYVLAAIKTTIIMKRQLILTIFLISLIGQSTTLFAQKNKPSAWDKKRIDVWVITIDLDTFQGQILNADESGLDLWMSDRPYSSDNYKVRTKEFTPEEIKEIYLRRNGQVGKKIIANSIAWGAFGGISGVVAASPSLGGMGNPTLSGIAGAILAAPLGITIGLIWGKIFKVNKNLKIEGTQANYLNKLDYISSKALLNNDWGTEFYWERKKR
ncbi:MAG: hypothetical protein KDD99_04290 [Bacteroidetes bacterium]|nr:hypothetical protein [Bacteroidota bacterium]